MSAFVSAVYYDDVLSMWVRGLTAPEITDSLGDPMTLARVTDIIKRARRSGDPRAVAKKRGGSRPHDSVWTPERKARLADLIDAGYTGRHIASEMEMTLGQVAGYISRNCLRLARPANGGNGKPKAPKPEKKRTGGPLFNVGFKRRAFVQPKAVNIDGAQPIRSIFEKKPRRGGSPACARAVEFLPDELCRFPIGDPRSSDFHFCSDERVVGRPYCSAHLRIAYTDRSDAA